MAGGERFVNQLNRPGNEISGERHDGVDTAGWRRQANPRMAGPADPPATERRIPVFPIACWVLGLVVFVQVLVSGLALSARLDASREVRVVEKEVTRIVAVPPRPEVASAAPEAVVVRPPRAVPPPDGVALAGSLPPPTPLRTPVVGDPRTEQLVVDAKRARVRGDMGLAILKLEEAKSLSAAEPLVFFEMGETLEAMGVFDRASDCFETVMGMGATKAGALYQRAAAKLEEGFLPEPVTGKLRLGKARVFKDPDHPGGFQVQLTVPVEKAPDAEVLPDDLDVIVEFFNHSKRAGIEPADRTWVTVTENTKRWDWSEGPETVHMVYQIPGRDPMREYLPGELGFYGQVVTLLYRGEVVDVDAWPRDLAVRSYLRGQPQNLPGGDGLLLPPLEADGILLPPLDDYGLPLPPP